MDPKQSAQLDPKLQEIYDRVMGTSVPQQPPLPAVQPTIQSQSVVPEPITVQPKAATITAATTPMPTQTAAPVLAPDPLPATPPQTPINLPQMSASALDSINPAPAVPAKKKFTAFMGKKNMKMDFKVSPAILIVGAVAFLLIYTVIWVKVFNLSVPIINP